MKPTMVAQTDAHSVADQRSRTSIISDYLTKSEHQDKRVIKILLLGSGSFGKSTFFRQLDMIYGEASQPNHVYSNEPYIIRTIRSNCIDSMFKLLTQSIRLCEKPFEFEDVKTDIESQETWGAIKLLASYATDPTNVPDDDDLRLLGAGMAMLWEMKGVKATFRHRHHFSLIENTNYFLSRVVTVVEPGYRPSIEDILNARMQTSGTNTKTYVVHGHPFNIFDVGGQRNERRKWLSLFDRVNLLLFIAALNHYSSALFEDETKNAIHESLELFGEMVTSKWFPPQYTQFVLFLNKNDLFKERLTEDKIPMSVAFGDEYTSHNFADKSEEELSDPAVRAKWAETCYQESLAFIKKKYLSKLTGAPHRRLGLRARHDGHQTGHDQGGVRTSQQIVIERTRDAVTATHSRTATQPHPLHCSANIYLNAPEMFKFFK